MTEARYAPSGEMAIFGTCLRSFALSMVKCSKGGLLRRATITYAVALNRTTANAPPNHHRTLRDLARHCFSSLSVDGGKTILVPTCSFSAIGSAGPAEDTSNSSSGAFAAWALVLVRDSTTNRFAPSCALGTGPSPAGFPRNGCATISGRTSAVN